MAKIEIRPNEGPQERFLSSPADICIFGGQAGGGKTYGILLEPLRHVNTVQGFGAVIFRRTCKQIRNEGGLWDTSNLLYPYIGGEPRESLEWKFKPYGNKITFSHLEYDKDRFNWDGAQIPLIGFDELIHFSDVQFFYLLSRNRSMCGVKPYIRATTNPDADSWVAKFISWWIDQETGYPIQERAGILQWFYRLEDRIFWYDSKNEAIGAHPDLAKISDPKSVTFIPSSIYDNPPLLERNPDYLANLMALPLIERERLAKGNWKIKAIAGKIFNGTWKIESAIPIIGMQKVRYWDKAGTEDGGKRTCGVLMAKADNGLFYVEDVIKGQWSAYNREQVILQTAHMDGNNVEIWTEQEPGSGGKESAESTIRNLAGFIVYADKVTGDKIERAMPYAAQVEAGNVILKNAEWNRDFTDEHFNFPNSSFKDQVDAAAGAFNKLNTKSKQYAAISSFTTRNEIIKE